MDKKRKVASEIAKVTTSTWITTDPLLIHAPLSSTSTGTITWTTTVYSTTAPLAQSSQHRGIISPSTSAHSVNTILAPSSDHRAEPTSTADSYLATTVSALTSDHSGATISTTTAFSATTILALPSGHREATTSTKTAFSATTVLATPSSHQGATTSTTTAVSATVALAPSAHDTLIVSSTATVYQAPLVTTSTTTGYSPTVTLVPRTNKTRIVTSTTTLYSVPLATTSTTTPYLAHKTRIATSTTSVYSSPPVTTSTTTAYAAVTASQVAVVLDMPPHGMGDQPSGTGVRGGSRHQIDKQGGGSTSKVVLFTLSILTLILVLVAVATAGQCMVRFLRKMSSTVTAKVSCLAVVSPTTSEIRRSRSSSFQAYEPLPQTMPLITECTLLDEKSKLYEDIVWIFQSKWDTTDWMSFDEPGEFVECPEVHEVWHIEAEPHFGTYLRKQAEIDTSQGHKHGYAPGNEQMRFHGARIKCRFNGVPCRDTTCNVCRIIEDGNFQSSSIRNEIRFERGAHAAKGYGLAPGKNPPPQNMLDFVSKDAGNAVFIAAVLLGKPDFVSSFTTDLPSPGSHSRVAERTTGVDEVVIFDPAQAIPRALLLFQ